MLFCRGLPSPFFDDGPLVAISPCSFDSNLFTTQANLVSQFGGKADTVRLWFFCIIWHIMHLRKSFNRLLLIGYVPLLSVLDGTLWALQWASVPTESCATLVLEKPESPSRSFQRFCAFSKASLLHYQVSLSSGAILEWAVLQPRICSRNGKLNHKHYQRTMTANDGVPDDFSRGSVLFA